MATKKKTSESTAENILVGTFRKENAEWIKEHKLYNLPLPSCGKVAFHESISQIVLLADGFQAMAFAAKFREVVDAAWLKENGYKVAAADKAHGTSYALYELGEKVSLTAALSNPNADVFVASSRCPSVKIDAAFYAKPYPKTGGKSMPYIFDKLKPYFKKWHSATTFDPVQLDFFVEAVMPYARTKKGNYTIASLFAGCGGLDLGFLGGFHFLGTEFVRNKFDVVWANEINPHACKTYKRNLGNHIVCGDIKDKIKEIPSNVDIIMGGFPCQDISINGKMLGIKGSRSSLYSFIVEAVKRSRPKIFLAENVGSLMLKQHEESFKKILSDFEALNYNVTYKVYHSEEYGVPQTRSRIIFVGTRKDLPHFVPPVPLNNTPISCGAALRDLESLPENKAFSHIWSSAAPSGDQGNRRMLEHRPGYTIRAECHGNIQFHYKLPRRLSMREAARIQSFPDSFIFPCGIRETERQVGNAVPPVLAWHIAQSIQSTLDGESHD